MLKAENVSVIRNGIKILDNVNFSLEKGEILLVIGPNGSGKSTLFKALIGLIDFDGKVTLNGRDISDLRPHERFKLGIVLAPERMRCALELSVKENIEIAGSFDEAKKIFPEIEKIKNRKVEKLSGGERQLVVFSRAFVSNPKYLLLDEPFQAVSDELSERMLKEIEHMRRNCGIAVISHDKIDELAEISDRVYLMVAGRIRKEFSGDEIKKLEKYMVI